METRKTQASKRIRFYHVSPKRLPVGTALRPGSGRWGVFLTTSPVPHYTLIEEVVASKRRWHCYEVCPSGKLVVGMWDDLVAEGATVVRYVGNARGIAMNRRKAAGLKAGSSQIVGSAVDPRIHPHGVKVSGRGISLWYPTSMYRKKQRGGN